MNDEDIKKANDLVREREMLEKVLNEGVVDRLVLNHSMILALGAHKKSISDTVTLAEEAAEKIIRDDILHRIGITTEELANITGKQPIDCPSFISPPTDLLRVYGDDGRCYEYKLSKDWYETV